MVVVVTLQVKMEGLNAMLCINFVCVRSNKAVLCVSIACECILLHITKFLKGNNFKEMQILASLLLENKRESKCPDCIPSYVCL